MKDKRQKMTLSWPCGDPVLAAYVLQAAAASGQLPYPGLFAAAAAASSHFGLMPPRPPHFGGPMQCRPPPSSPPGLFGPLMHHPGGHHSLGTPGRSPPHDFSGLVDRQSPASFFTSRESSSALNPPTGFSRAVTPPPISVVAVDLPSMKTNGETEPLSPSSSPLGRKSSRDMLITDLKEKERNSSRPAASLFQPYLDVDKK